MPEHHDDGIVTVGERVGLDDHLVTDDPLDRELPSVDLGRDVLDDGASPVGEGGPGGVAGGARRFGGGRADTQADCALLEATRGRGEGVGRRRRAGSP
jgi:hypothetical protein